MGVAAQALLRTISKVAGADIVHDAVAFFQAFEGMEEGFRTRAARVRELLAQDGHGLRPGGLAPARLGRRGRPLRRQAGRVGHVGDRPGRQPGPAPLRRRRRSWPAGRRWPADGAGQRRSAELIENLPRLHRGLGPRGAGLRRPGGQGGPGPRLPGPAVEHRRPRPRRAGHHRRPAVHRADGPAGRRRRTGTWARTGGALTWCTVRTILVASDAPSVRAEVAAIAGQPGHHHPRGPLRARGDGRGGRVAPRSGGGRPADGQHGRHGGLPRAPAGGVLRQARARPGAHAARPAPRRVPGPAVRGRGVGGQAARPDPAPPGGHRPARRGHLLRRVLPALSVVSPPVPAGA